MRWVLSAMWSLGVVGALAACGAGTRAPAEPRSEERRCTEDSDCVFRPDDPCECAPCGTAWRRAVSQRTATDLLTEIAAQQCEPPDCEPCETTWRGTEPVCVDGQCTVRHTQ